MAVSLTPRTRLMFTDHKCVFSPSYEPSQLHLVFYYCLRPHEQGHRVYCRRTVYLFFIILSKFETLSVAGDAVNGQHVRTARTTITCWNYMASSLMFKEKKTILRWKKTDVTQDSELILYITYMRFKPRTRVRFKWTVLFVVDRKHLLSHRLKFWTSWVPYQKSRRFFE